MNSAKKPQSSTQTMLVALANSDTVGSVTAQLLVHDPGRCSLFSGIY